MVCALWSGGKDCFAALLHAARDRDIAPADVLLVTFVPPRGGFACHPLGLLAEQALGLGATWERLVIDPDDWEASYAAAMRWLADEAGVREVVSGDQLDGPASVRRHWLAQLVDDAGMRLAAPLAGRGSALQRVAELPALGITAIVTGVRDARHAPLLGQPLSVALLRDAGCLEDPGFDACGEGGEYHTVVTAHDGRRFADRDLAALPRMGARDVTALRLPRAWAAETMARRTTHLQAA